MARSRNTVKDMQVNNISPHAMGKSGAAGVHEMGHERMIAPGALDQVGIQRSGEGVVSKFQDSRTKAIYAGRDTPLTAGRPEGRKGYQGDPVTGKQTQGLGTPGAANWDHDPTHDGLYGTQADDREGFAAPNQRVSRTEKNPAEDGKSSRQGSKQK